MRTFMREKKIYCGKKYMEVDIYPYTKSQNDMNRGGRSKRQNVSEVKQKNLNDKNARRYLTQLANTNFGEDDLHVTATYKKENLPDSVEEAEKAAANYLRRIKYRREKAGLAPLKYILVTEYSTGKDGQKPVRIHHHILMNGGLSRDEVEDLWCKRRKKGQKKGERLGFVNADRLQPDANGIAALCAYLTKNPNGKKRWSSSQNLEKPFYRTNDHKYSRREVEKVSKGLMDASYWEKRYPGWILADKDYSIQAEYNEYTGWSVYLKLCRKE